MFDRTRSTPTPASCWRPSPRASRRRADPRRRRWSMAADVKVWFPIQRGLLRRTVGHVKAVDGVSLTVRAGRDAGPGRRERLGQDHAGPGAPAADRQPGRASRFDGRDIQGAVLARAAAAAPARCRSSSRTRSAASARACRWARSSAEGLELHEIGDGAAARRSGGRGAGARSGSIPPTRTATRTSSPAASASASRSPAPWS